ncbi:MAG TPA: hypothetical protein RMH99_04850 [Sandaracinaceae bacterium LLY-WYZ-13_1]|nr:hypothetical protein [Sandaracinaceae bacterium LLY-WYZ-13_1]
MRLFVLALALLLAAAPAHAQDDADAVVVARRGADPGSWPACGVLSVVGEVVFETVRVESGDVPARFVATVQCPASEALDGVQRLRLSRRARPPGSVYPPRAPDDLPRFHLVSHELAEAPAGLARFLGRRRHALARRYPPSRAAGGWTHYGDVLAVRIEGRRIVEVRARLPRDMTCREAAEWMGYDDAGPPLRRRSACEWPGISRRHRLAAGLQGRLAEGLFEVRRR